MLRRDDKACLFKIADGTMIFSEHACIEDDGVTFDMESAWIVVTKTDESGKADARLYSGKELLFKPTMMYFPWTSIIMASDAEDSAKEMFKKALSPSIEPTKMPEGLHLDKKA